MSNSKSVEENLVALISKIGEKITIGKTKTIQNVNSQNYIYQHSVIKDNVSKLGVVVSLKPKKIMNKSILLENNCQCTLQHQIQ